MEIKLKSDKMRLKMNNNKQCHLTIKEWKTMNNLKVFDNSTEIQGILKIVFKNNTFNKKKIKTDEVERKK